MKINGTHEVIARIAGPGLVLATLLAMVLAGSIAGRAQASATSPAVPAATPAKAAPAANAAQPTAASERKPGGNHEGITVHGHWIIEVRNPDGKLATRREFDNSLTGSGSVLLANLLSGQASSGGWAIVLSVINPATNGTEFPCGNSGGVYPCTIYSAPVSNCATATANCFPTLTVSPTSYQNVASGTAGVTLQGTAVAGNNSGVVGFVATYMAQCASTVAPGNCTTANGNIQLGVDWYLNNVFTSRNLDGVGTDPQPVNVTSGQTISVTVMFTFASGS